MGGEITLILLLRVLCIHFSCFKVAIFEEWKHRAELIVQKTIGSFNEVNKRSCSRFCKLNIFVLDFCDLTASPTSGWSTRLMGSSLCFTSCIFQCKLLLKIITGVAFSPITLDGFLKHVWKNDFGLVFFSKPDQMNEAWKLQVKNKQRRSKIIWRELMKRGSNVWAVYVMDSYLILALITSVQGLKCCYYSTSAFFVSCISVRLTNGGLSLIPHMRFISGCSC